MSPYRTNLPQLAAPLFLTDGGIETSLIFDEGIELPDFAAFVLLDHEAGRAALERYFAAYLAIARRDGVGIVLETPTWRASADWAARLGYSVERIAEINREAVAFLTGLRDRQAGRPVVVSGCIGPRGDGYQPGEAMTVDEARRYHALQVRAFAEAGADLVTAITMTNPQEATGLVLAAREAGMPVVISFTVETDGTLPSGRSLGEAIVAVDAATDGYPAYYMVNCAHPTHFDRVLDPAAPWIERIKGIRANASRRSHAELDGAAELDAGDAEELAEQYRELRRRHPGVVVLGGCCGTNHVHVGAISQACAASAPDEHVVDLPNGVQLAYATQGPAGGVPVVLVHGWPDSWRSFTQVMAALPPEIRAVAVSLRGFGGSSRPAGGYEPAEFAQDVVALMDVLGLHDAVLVGHSMGSLVVQRLALAHPARVRALVLIGGFAALGGALAGELTEVLATLGDPVDEGFVRQFQASALTRPLAEGFFDTLVAESTLAPARVWRAAFAGLVATDLHPELDRITVPVRLLWGDDDGLIPGEEQDRLLAALADAELVVYRGAGHSPNWEEPARVAADIVQVADRVSSMESAARTR